MREPKESLFTRHFILICVIAVCFNTPVRMLDSVLASFVNETWASKSLGGLLTTFFNIGSIGMAFLCGPLVARFGSKRCLIAGACLYCVPTFFCSIFPTQAFLLFTRLLQGVAKGVVAVAASSVVADVTPRSRMNEGMGIYNLGSTAAMAFGPMMGLALASSLGYPSVFVAAAAVYFSVVLWCQGLRYDSGGAAGVSAAQPGAENSGYHGIWRLIERRALLPSLNYTVCFASFAGILVFITVYSQEILQLSAQQIGLFYTAAAGSMLAVRLAFGKVADRFGPIPLLLPGHLCIVLSLVMLAFCAKGNYPVYLLCGALYGAANSTLQPTFNALAVTESPRRRSSIANATFYFTMDFGILFGSVLYGAIIDAAATSGEGYRNMFLCSIAVCLVSLAISLAAFNSRARKKRMAAIEK